jgi:2-(1,2-epoxy-1,2-dihydrophenyl)acetyl-CoA isomerase
LRQLTLRWWSASAISEKGSSKLEREASVSDSDDVLYRVSDRIAIITLNRPEARNAISHAVAAELVGLLRRADGDPNVKCILIRGTGENFSAGGDVKGFNEKLKLSPGERYEHFERAMLLGNRLPRAMLESSKPIIAATRGAVAGAAVALCLAADFVIAAESTYFLVAHVHIGLCIDCGLSSLLVAAIGIKSAKRLALLGEKVMAEEALALGFVTRVVSESTLESEVENLASRLTKGPAMAMARSKELLNRSAYPGFVDLLAAEAISIATCSATEDFQRGVRGLLDRKPVEFE